MEESTTQSTVKGTSIKWGLINAGVGIGFFVLVDLLGQAQNQSIQWIGLVIFAVLLYLAHKEFKEGNDGYMSYGQGLGIGTLTALISSILSGIFTFIYVSFINTGLIEAAREKAITDMEDRGSSQAEIDQAMPFIEMFTSPTAYLVISIVAGVFFGFLVSLIMSAITQKKRPENMMG